MMVHLHKRIVRDPARRLPLRREDRASIGNS
jgi:hypothetical protein